MNLRPWILLGGRRPPPSYLKQQPCQTLQATDLLPGVYLRLVDLFGRRCARI